MASKKRRTTPQRVRAAPQQLVAELAEVDSLLRRRRPAEAAQRLETLHQRYPGRAEVLVRLVNACFDQKDMRGYQRACERLLRIQPDDPDATLGLAGSYLCNVRPALALRTFRRFLERWPDHPRSAEIRESVAGLEIQAHEMLEDAGLTGADAPELGALHEEAQSLMEQGDLARAARTAEQLVRQRPGFVPALNNLSQIYALAGRLGPAIATAERVLAADPGNFHALANLVRYLCLSGRGDEAREQAGRLKAVRSDAPDVWAKKAEALSYLGDDAGVLEVFEAGRRAGNQSPPEVEALLCHLGAVAALRLGNEREARRHWQQSLRLAPGLDLARDNLEDLRKPARDRHAPWAFGFANWVPREIVDDLIATVTKGGAASPRSAEDAVQRAARRFLREHPTVAGLIPLLLDRGDPMGREFALRTAMVARTPELVEALRDFALGQRGPDDLRNQAAQVALEEGLLSPGPMRFWIDGEWQELVLLGFQVHGEPRSEHSPRVEQWSLQAGQALREGKGEEAERLLRQALEVEPRSPDLLNNLAVAYGRQGRRQESLELLRRIHDEYPDYLFARVSMAQLAIRERDYARARSLLDPLLTHKEFHFSEFAALAQAQMELLLAEGKRDGAQHWLEMWESLDPDNPHIESWRQRVRPHSPLRWTRKR